MTKNKKAKIDAGVSEQLNQCATVSIITNTISISCGILITIVASCKFLSNPIIPVDETVKGISINNSAYGIIGVLAIIQILAQIVSFVFRKK